MNVAHLCDMQKFWELFVTREKYQYFYLKAIFREVYYGTLYKCHARPACLLAVASTLKFMQLAPDHWGVITKKRAEILDVYMAYNDDSYYLSLGLNVLFPLVIYKLFFSIYPRNVS